MPHTKLVEHSTAMAAAVGDAYAQVSKLRASGIPTPAMAVLGTLEGALSRIADKNAAMGEVAHGLTDDAPVDDKSAKASTGSASDKGSRAA
ncbi:hypothetical protein ABC766_00275 [Methylobacterium fujisawaense]|jgi:hypothetical protein|uniref:hypothetical protein n=1 Tax=Methylobacterium fujisawaense TaxID=107400 RepID=UPI0031F54331